MFSQSRKIANIAFDNTVKYLQNSYSLEKLMLENIDFTKIVKLGLPLWCGIICSETLPCIIYISVYFSNLSVSGVVVWVDGINVFVLKIFFFFKVRSLHVPGILLIYPIFLQRPINESIKALGDLVMFFLNGN